jgi:hypothetical protein
MGGQGLGTEGGSSDGGSVGDAGAGQAGSGPLPVDCLSSPDAPIVSGSRLKVRCLRGADGSQTYVRGRLFDSELGVDCTYRTAADGSWRCLPTLHPMAGALVYFTDDQCMVPTAWIDDSCLLEPPPTHVFSYVSSDCAVSNNELPVKVYAVIAQTTVPGPIYAETESGCDEVSKPGFASVVFSVSEELPVTTFVEGSKELAP